MEWVTGHDQGGCMNTVQTHDIHFIMHGVPHQNWTANAADLHNAQIQWRSPNLAISTLALARPDYFAGIAKWMASCLNHSITFCGHVNFLIRRTRDLCVRVDVSRTVRPTLPREPLHHVCLSGGRRRTLAAPLSFDIRNAGDLDAIFGGWWIRRHIGKHGRRAVLQFRFNVLTFRNHWAKWAMTMAPITKFQKGPTPDCEVWEYNHIVGFRNTVQTHDIHFVDT